MQSGHVPFPSVQSALEVHALDDGWLQVPVPMPVQQRNVVPSLLIATPQLPDPTAVVNCSRVGSGMPH